MKKLKNLTAMTFLAIASMAKAEPSSITILGEAANELFRLQEAGQDLNSISCYKKQISYINGRWVREYQKVRCTLEAREIGQQFERRPSSMNRNRVHPCNLPGGGGLACAR